MTSTKTDGLSSHVEKLRELADEIEKPWVANAIRRRAGLIEDQVSRIRDDLDRVRKYPGNSMALDFLEASINRLATEDT
jgi:hypothetical protein